MEGYRPEMLRAKLKHDHKVNSRLNTWRLGVTAVSKMGWWGCQLAHRLDAQCRQGSLILLILLIAPAGAVVDVGSRCLGIMTIGGDHFKKGSDGPCRSNPESPRRRGEGVGFLCDARGGGFFVRGGKDLLASRKWLYAWKRHGTRRQSAQLSPLGQFGQHSHFRPWGCRDFRPTSDARRPDRKRKRNDIGCFLHGCFAVG
jgi:hypothetical protein